MTCRSIFFLMASLVIQARAIAQCEDYQMLKAINSSAPLINYLDKNGFKEVTNPDCDCLYYEGKYKGDFLKVGKGWKGEVFEMSWSTLDEAGNTLPDRLLFNSLQFMPTYKENRKRHPGIFGNKKAEPEGTHNVVNYGLGESKVIYHFEDANANKNPKLIRISMLSPNNRDRQINAMNKRSNCLRNYAAANIPEGTDKWAKEIVDGSLFHFKAIVSLKLKKDEVVTLDLPNTILHPEKNKYALLLVKPKDRNAYAHINFKVNSEDDQFVGESDDLGKARNNTIRGVSYHKLVTNVDYPISFRADLVLTEETEVDVIYFEGPQYGDKELAIAYNAKDLLIDKDYVAPPPPYVDAFARRLELCKESGGYTAEISEAFAAASKRSILHNETINSGTHHFYIKAEGDLPPSLRLDFESYITEVNNRGSINLDKDHGSYRYVDGYHFFEFELKIDNWGWMLATSKNAAGEAQKLTWHIHKASPDPTLEHVEMSPFLSTRTEDYFEIIKDEMRQRQEKAKRDMENFGNKYARTPDENLNAATNRITKAAIVMQEGSRKLTASIGQLDAGEDLSANFKSFTDAFDSFKTHISQANIYAIRSGCDDLYDLISEIEDSWFENSGTSVRVPLARLEQAAKTRNIEDFGKRAQEFVTNMKAIADKMTKALDVAEGCR